jgi:hypothetical protein
MATLKWTCSYDGESDYEGYVKGRLVKLVVRYAKPWNPSKFASGVYPQQIAAVGTIRMEWWAADGFPPSELVSEVEDLIRSQLCVDTTGCTCEWCTGVRERLPLRPIMFDMASRQFVDREGQPAHIVPVDQTTPEHAQAAA